MDKQLSILPNSNLPVLRAYNEKEGVKGVMALNAEKSQLRITIEASLAKAFVATHKDIEEDDFPMLIDEVMSEVLRAYASIRLEEIALAIHKGAIGDYGIVYNLSLNTIVGWLRTYISSEARLLALKESNKGVLLLGERTKPTEEEQEQVRLIIMLGAWERFLKTEKYNDFNNIIFNLLCDRDIINNQTFTQAEQDKIWKDAKAVLRAKFTRVARTADERFENKRKLKEINEHPTHPLIDAEARQLGLIHFFRRCKEQAIDVGVLIK